MDKKLKAKWVKALRSGRYKQAKGKLLDEDGSMCCLGVLREIIEPGSREGKGGGNGMLSGRMLTVAGLPEDASPEAATGATCLSALNDQGNPFPKIADYIEKHL